MDSRERFYCTLTRQPLDYPATWLGIPDKNAIPGLMKYFGTKTVEEIKTILNDDIWPVEVPFNLAPNYHIAGSLNFAKTLGSNDERTLTAPGYFEDFDDPEDIKLFDWPSPSKCIDTKESLERVKRLPSNKIRMGMMWSAHFQDACSAFGMETALIKMLMNPEMFLAVINRIVDYYLEANAIFYEATKGYLDAVLIGNDFGSQTGLIVDPELLRQYVFKGTKKLVDQAKSFGLKVIHHSCGSIYEIIPDLAEIGVDCIHPIQALAANMEPQKLKDNFGEDIAFCGGVDAQNLLVNGSPDQVDSKVTELRRIFPTGLIISPSHEAILPDTRPENIVALFNAVRKH